MTAVNIVVPLFAALAVLGTVPAPAPSAVGCGSSRVPGADHQESSRTTDLTTAGGLTDPADWAGLTPAGLAAPTAVPGTQVDGYFPDDSTTNTNHGWNHDSQFVIRLPRHWNGGLVVTGSPGVREQYANDRAIGDWVLQRGYAFAATDKGNTGVEFHTDGAAIEEWNERVTQLARAAKALVRLHYCRPPTRTIATGLSNGGYLVRWQLENHPELYDGGVDWEGVLWREEGPNLLTFLPPALRGEPVFPAESEFLWPFYRQYYWELTQRVYREELDPDYQGAEADYDYRTRPAAQRAVRRIALTGRIGRPLITLHGTLDGLLPITQDSDVYADMVRGRGRAALFRYYRIEGGTHVDSLYDAHPDRVRPLTPCHHTAFAALERWLDGVRPPASATIARPTAVSPDDCALG
ncbi:tannase/feruloyl esterase family alpha/beta hydrolase [Umezawaea tangerina]|uniref:Tannase/feruloyl esterase n=1 Tax=Umezawaea tangerina TaxID=84725 RepID=A0A2T0SBY3_9PSEU|nr:tannase/feruloyl esterase [Umezawaea tangerina]